MRVKMHVKKGDTVLVASGKYKGRVGKVKEVLPKKYAVIVEGVNIVKKAVRVSPKYPQGGFIEKEAPARLQGPPHLPRLRQAHPGAEEVPGERQEDPGLRQVRRGPGHGGVRYALGRGP